MRMTDIVSSLDMTVFPIAGFAVFAIAFGAIIARTILADSRETRRAASLPFRTDDD